MAVHEVSMLVEEIKILSLTFGKSNIWERPIIGAGRRSNTSNIGANHHKSTINKSTSRKTSYLRTCLLRLCWWWRNPFGGWSCCPGVGPWMALVSFDSLIVVNSWFTHPQDFVSGVDMILSQGFPRLPENEFPDDIRLEKNTQPWRFVGFFSTFRRQETYYLGAGFCDHQPRWGGFIFKMWK